jgi:hypothetical protein
MEWVAESRDRVIMVGTADAVNAVPERARRMVQGVMRLISCLQTRERKSE